MEALYQLSYSPVKQSNIIGARTWRKIDAQMRLAEMGPGI
jgi:hypothetical protein